MQLVEENAELARVYKGKCITEQNAVDVAWNLLLQEQFSELRATICETEAEMSRFRQLVVNMVLAMDVMDKNPKNVQNA